MSPSRTIWTVDASDNAHISVGVSIHCPVCRKLAAAAGSIGAVGSSGQKPRKPNQRHLPKVGSSANVNYEVSQKRREVFRGWPWIIVAVLLVMVLLAFILIT